jgi:hypothetical protein
MDKPSARIGSTPPLLPPKTKYLTVLLKNGEKFRVKGQSILDTPNNVGGRFGWCAFELVNGKVMQIWSEEISAIYECEGFI